MAQHPAEHRGEGGGAVIAEVERHGGHFAALDQPGQRGPIVAPLTCGTAISASSTLRVLVPPEPLLPQRVYSVAVIGYDGTVYDGTFSVNERIAVR